MRFAPVAYLLFVVVLAHLAAIGCTHHPNPPESDSQPSLVPVKPTGTTSVESSLPIRHDSSADSTEPPRWSEVGQLVGHQDAIKSLAFLAEGARLVSGSFDGVVKVWDLRSRAEVDSFSAHPEGRFGQFAISPNSDRLATGGFDGKIRVWDTATWQKVCTLRGSSVIYCLSFSADGSVLATSGKRNVDVWDLKTQNKVSTVKAGFWPITGVGFSPDGHTLFVGGFECFERVLPPTAGGLMRAYDVASGQLKAEAKSAEPVSALCVSRKGELIAVGAAGVERFQLVRRGDRLEFQKLGSFLKTHEVLGRKILQEQFTAVTLDETPTLIAASAASPGPLAPRAGHVRVFDANTGRPIALLVPDRPREPDARPGTFSLKAVAVSRDGRWIAAGGNQKVITLWEREASGKPLDPTIVADIETPTSDARQNAEQSRVIESIPSSWSFDRRRLALLQKTYLQQRDQFLQVAQGFANREERDVLFQDLFPRRQHLIARLLELTKDTRESDTRFDALAFALYLSRQSMTEDLSTAREQVIDLLIQDHLQDPELARVFYLLEHVPNSQSERLFRAATQDSTDPAVRGHAHYSYGNYLCRKAAIVRMVTSLERQDGAITRSLEALGSETVAELSAADPKELEAAAELQFQHVIRDFPAVVKRPETYDRIADPQRADVVGWKAVPLGQVAQRALFAMREISIGHKAPDIEGKDANGTDFKLSDYRGKVVLLCFSGDWCSSCVARYPQYRELVEQFKNRRFALLQVNSDSTLESLRRSMVDGKITWRCWWDGPPPDGQIATTWHVEAWPTLYLLDHQGILRYRNVFGEALDQAVANLVAEAMSG